MAETAHEPGQLLSEIQPAPGFVSGEALDEEHARALLTRAVLEPCNPPQPLTPVDVQGFLSASYDRLDAQVVTTILLRCAGETMDYRAHTQVTDAQDKLDTLRFSQANRLPAMIRAQEVARAAKEAALSAGTISEQKLAKNALRKLDTNISLARRKTKVAEEVLGTALAAAAPYHAMLTAVKPYEERYRTKFFTHDGTSAPRANTTQIYDAIIEPSDDIQHPSLDLLSGIREQLGNRAIEPERVLRLILLDILGVQPTDGVE